MLRYAFALENETLLTAALLAPSIHALSTARAAGPACVGETLVDGVTARADSIAAAVAHLRHRLAWVHA